uniref:Uncharacterized protein n=1 Tax=Timema poppense TaxID=170557 RepID=A0A7R9HEF3_TIMPO|nr:unnamed protein product [Timema poppensis]
MSIVCDVPPQKRHVIKLRTLVKHASVASWSKADDVEIGVRVSLRRTFRFFGDSKMDSIYSSLNKIPLVIWRNRM